MSSSGGCCVQSVQILFLNGFGHRGRPLGRPLIDTFFNIPHYRSVECGTPFILFTGLYMYTELW